MKTEKKSVLDFKRIFKATYYSFLGLKAAWKNEAAFKQEIILASILIPVAMFIGTTATQRALLIATCLIVILTELVNSAIEAIVDRIGSEKHELSGRAKDLGSAAVFITLMQTVIVWGLIIFERFSK